MERTVLKWFRKSKYWSFVKLLSAVHYFITSLFAFAVNFSNSHTSAQSEDIFLLSTYSPFLRIRARLTVSLLCSLTHSFVCR